MAHATSDDLSELGVMLAELRRVPVLKEKSLGCFYRKGKGVLHFHTKLGRLYAHVFTGESWAEVDIVVPMSERKQKTVSKEVVRLLAVRE